MYNIIVVYQKVTSTNTHFQLYTQSNLSAYFISPDLWPKSCLHKNTKFSQCTNTNLNRFNILFFSQQLIRWTTTYLDCLLWQGQYSFCMLKYNAWKQINTPILVQEKKKLQEMEKKKPQERITYTKIYLLAFEHHALELSH